MAVTEEKEILTAVAGYPPLLERDVSTKLPEQLQNWSVYLYMGSPAAPVTWILPHCWKQYFKSAIVLAKCLERLPGVPDDPSSVKWNQANSIFWNCVSETLWIQPNCDVTNATAPHDRYSCRLVAEIASEAQITPQKVRKTKTKKTSCWINTSRENNVVKLATQS